MDLAPITALMRGGFNAPDLADLIVRSSVGIFSTMSGGNKLFVKSRHEALCRTLQRLGIPSCGGLMGWWVPGWTFVGGIMLTLGVLSAFAASVLLCVYLVAFACEARAKVEAYGPINCPDRIADYLYLPETLYIVLLAAALIHGTGHYSLDWLLWGAK